MEEENQGSLLLGVVLGFFLGCIGIGVAFLLKGSKTLTGSIIGVVLQVVMGTCLGVGLFALQLFLVSASS